MQKFWQISVIGHEETYHAYIHVYMYMYMYSMSMKKHITHTPVHVHVCVMMLYNMITVTPISSDD